MFDFEALHQATAEYEANSQDRRLKEEAEKQRLFIKAFKETSHYILELAKSRINEVTQKALLERATAGHKYFTLYEAYTKGSYWKDRYDHDVLNPDYVFSVKELQELQQHFLDFSKENGFTLQSVFFQKGKCTVTPGYGDDDYEYEFEGYRFNLVWK